jgi:hypothetical protein
LNPRQVVTSPANYFPQIPLFLKVKSYTTNLAQPFH